MWSNNLRFNAIFLALASPVVAMAQSGSPPWAGYAVVDMTHSFDAETIYWPTEEGFELEVGFDGITEGGYYYASNRYSAADHGGTHLDAPRHFAEGKQSADEVPLDRLMGPACVIDVSEAALANSEYRLRASDIEEWEAENGRIEQGCIILLNTGYAQFWPDRQSYLGTALRGTEGVENLHFPGHSEEAARILVDRGIAAVGIDTASIDYGQSDDFRVHRYLYDLNIPAFENVANIDALPPEGAYLIALPMKISTESGAPLRIVGPAHGRICHRRNRYL
jgi:kynurenine formamidase